MRFKICFCTAGEQHPPAPPPARHRRLRCPRQLSLFLSKAFLLKSPEAQRVCFQIRNHCGRRCFPQCKTCSEDFVFCSISFSEAAAKVGSSACRLQPLLSPGTLTLAASCCCKSAASIRNRLRRSVGASGWSVQWCFGFKQKTFRTFMSDYCCDQIFRRSEHLNCSEAPCYTGKEKKTFFKIKKHFFVNF